jgi:beta-glucanase (GH16 family)
MPSQSKSSVHMTLETYNPTGFSKYGSQITSKKSFTVTADVGLSVSVKAKLNSPIKGGGVMGIFLYQVKPDGINHDEVDTEILTNDALKGPAVVRSNVYSKEPLGVGHPGAATIPHNGKLTEFHTYTMKVLSNKVLWYIDNHLVRTEKSIVPTGPMKFYLNFWAPVKDWSLAYNSKFKSVSSLSKNTKLTYDVDSVVVRSVPKPTSPAPEKPKISITSIPRLGNSGSVSGKVTGAITSINSNGEWSGAITTGGIDASEGVEVRAYLIPKGFDVPLAGGGDLDPSLNNLFCVSKIRS